ncbi:hypothetical protein [Streptomyces sp. ME19-01-6]|uniref:hypothetical protein n=1 Tax=Streptomyces sp. ME19-01-6 TaxID=3028686 RepID=UPI0029BC9335|nr:hypothetical protein [Streptomyces sp. ME19-01-6]MDX3225382.1 hypothetical protein [Streptomyces sp. ME19-01-6]
MSTANTSPRRASALPRPPSSSSPCTAATFDVLAGSHGPDPADAREALCGTAASSRGRAQGKGFDGFQLRQGRKGAAGVVNAYREAKPRSRIAPSS